MINQALKRIIPVLFFLYPLLMFWGVRYFDPALASIVLVVILSARLLFFRQLPKNVLGKMFEIVLWVVLLNNILNIYFRSELLLKLYPCIMSIGVAAVFTASLFRGTPMIENFARLHDGELSPSKILYTRKLTVLWSGWLILNSLLSLYTTFFSDLKLWAIYNNLIFYVVSGILFSGDVIYRRFKHV